MKSVCLLACVAVALLSGCVFHTGTYESKLPPRPVVAPEQRPVVLVKQTTCEVGEESVWPMRDCAVGMSQRLNATLAAWAIPDGAFEADLFGQEFVPDLELSVDYRSRNHVAGQLELFFTATLDILTCGLIPAPLERIERSHKFTIGTESQSFDSTSRVWLGLIPYFKGHGEVGNSADVEKKGIKGEDKYVEAILAKLPATGAAKSTAVASYFREIETVGQEFRKEIPESADLAFCVAPRLWYLIKLQTVQEALADIVNRVLAKKNPEQAAVNDAGAKARYELRIWQLMRDCGALSEFYMFNGSVRQAEMAPVFTFLKKKAESIEKAQRVQQTQPVPAQPVQP